MRVSSISIYSLSCSLVCSPVPCTVAHRLIAECFLLWVVASAAPHQLCSPVGKPDPQQLARRAVACRPPSIAEALGCGLLWHPWSFLQGWHEDTGGNSSSLGSLGSGPACWGRTKRSAYFLSLLEFLALMGFPFESHYELVCSLVFSF